MLKKLAKYGNSTTLVIDKAILELLNMDESTIVKLQTDGKSLIITPAESADQGKRVSYEGFEALQASVGAFKKTLPKDVDKEGEVYKSAGKEFQALFEKHKDVFSKFTTEILPSAEFQQELSRIASQYDPVTQNKEYLKEYNKLKLQFCPELEEMDKEMDAINKKYAHLN